MSVRTTAENKRDEAKEYVEKAYKLLIEATDPETWGSEDWNKGYRNKLEKSISRLRKVKNSL